MIVTQVLTDQHTDDPSQVGPLLDQVNEEIKKSPPMVPMMVRPLIKRSRNMVAILRWLSHLALVETTMGRYKSIIGPRLQLLSAPTPRWRDTVFHRPFTLLCMARKTPHGTTKSFNT
jgi:hypothetical protein